MREKRRGSLLRWGLAALLAGGMVPAAFALASGDAQTTQTPPHRAFCAGRRRLAQRRLLPNRG